MPLPLPLFLSLSPFLFLSLSVRCMYIPRSRYIGEAVNNSQFDGVYFDCCCGKPPGVSSDDAAKFQSDSQAAFDRALALIKGANKWASAWNSDGTITAPNCAATMKNWITKGKNPTVSLQPLAPLPDSYNRNAGSRQRANSAPLPAGKSHQGPNGGPLGLLNRNGTRVAGTNGTLSPMAPGSEQLQHNFKHFGRLSTNSYSSAGKLKLSKLNLRPGQVKSSRKWILSNRMVHAMVGSLAFQNVCSVAQGLA